MSDVLDHIRSKVTRANQNIHDFQIAASAFFATNPYMVWIDENAQTQKRIYRLSRAEPVPDHLANIAADVIQNLRSPLDQIAYQLVIAANPSAVDEKIYYPICDLAAHYPSRIGTIKKHVRDQCVIDAIDATEPYNGGKGHALWQLNALNNPDKHRLPLLAGSYFRSVDVSGLFKGMFADMGVDVEVPPLRLRPADKMMPLKVGDELFIEPLFEVAPAILSPAAALRIAKDGRLHTKVDKDRKFTIEISFNQPGIIECEPAIKTMKDLANLIDGIVATLGAFLN